MQIKPVAARENCLYIQVYWSWDVFGDSPMESAGALEVFYINQPELKEAGREGKGDHFNGA